MKRIREAVDIAYARDQVAFLHAHFEEPDASLRGRFAILREQMENQEMSGKKNADGLLPTPDTLKSS